MDGINGKTISIISYDDIRYVGIIEGIDGENKIITISNVRIFGTEDRVTDPSKWILPRPEIYPKIELNGDSVKSLNILESNVNEITPILLPGMYQHQFNVPNLNNLSNITTGNINNSIPEIKQSNEMPKEELKEESKEKSKEESKEQPKEINQSKSTNIDLTKEFDFTENNAKFEKEADKPTLDAGVSYNKKSSFFDDLSSSVTDNKNDRMTWSEEKTLNEDTFGQASLNNNRNRGGRGRGGRGRGRGGRGRGRGRGNFRGRSRGRGGYNNNNSNNNGNYNTQPEWAF